MEPTRARNYRELITVFDAHTVAHATPPMPRYAAVSEEFFAQQRVGATIALCETQQEAFEFLGDSMLDGYAPDGVYDLGTAEKIDIEVSTPVVTRARCQGVSTNPLTG
jgi:hypothetical protein